MATWTENNNTTAGQVILNNGNAKCEERTVASELNIPAETELEYTGSQSRWVGTGYKNRLFRVVGTDDLVVVRENCGSVDNLYWDSVELKKGHFAEKRNYAKAVGKLSRKYGVPFDVALVVGTNEELYPQLVAAASQEIGEDLAYELYCGINRRKYALKCILGEELYAALGVGSMGQKHSSVLAYYFIPETAE